MSATKITYVQSNYWEGLYVDGVLTKERNEIKAIDAFDLAIQSGQFELSVIKMDEKWINNLEHLPLNLSDVVVRQS